MLQTNPENAAIVEKLADRLATLPIGSTLAYEDLIALADRDIQGRFRYLLDSAREKAEKRLGCIFECVRTVGIKRLPASECPEIGLAGLRKVRRTSKRVLKRYDRMNTNSLSDAEQRRVIAYQALHGAIATLADGNKARSVAVVAEVGKPIPPANIIDMFFNRV